MKVQIKNRSIMIDGEAVPLISGEVHYWRLDPSMWRKILEEVRKLGLEMICTYVPWEFHEIQPRVYDFTGKTDPRRNLKAYLELLEEMGFWILIRPGPYIYSEWKNLGIPDRVVQYHRTHPKLVEEARHYLQAVFKILNPHLASHGGRILMIQPDNELDPAFYQYEDQLGLTGKKGLFQEFLKEKYKNVLSLNRAWQTKYKSLDSAKPTCDLVSYNKNQWPRFRDFKEFIYWLVEKMGQVWCDEFRSLTKNIPLYFNMYGFYEIQPWKVLARQADFSALDLYPSQEFEFEASEHRDFLEKIRALRTVSSVPFIAEFQCGTWHGYQNRSGLLSPNHYRMSAISALLAGSIGWNWYMLVNRDNWYLCPIDERAQRREELACVFQELIRVFKEIRPQSLNKKTNIGVTFYPLHSTTRALSKEDPILKSLYEGDLDYEFVDVEESIPNKKVIFYSGASWLPEKAQKNLLKYVQAGGILISFLHYPHQDESLNSLTLLGFQEPTSVLGEGGVIFCEKFLEMRLADQTIDIRSPFFIFDKVLGTVIQAQSKTHSTYVGQANLLKDKKYTIGYIRKSGKGKIIHIGTSPTPALILALMKSLKIDLYSHASTPQVQTALYQRGKDFYLFIVNSGRETKSASIELHGIKSLKKATDLFSKKEYSIRMFQGVSTLHVSLERKSGTVLKLN